METKYLELLLLQLNIWSYSQNLRLLFWCTRQPILKSAYTIAINTVCSRKYVYIVNKKECLMESRLNSFILITYLWAISLK